MAFNDFEETLLAELADIKAELRRLNSSQAGREPKAVPAPPEAAGESTPAQPASGTGRRKVIPERFQQ